MKKQIYTIMGAALMTAMTLSAMAQNTVVSFENQALNEDGYWIGEENENGVSDGWGGMTYPCTYEEGGLRFNTSYSVYYWSGYAISNRTETTFENMTPDQYNSAAGKAHSGNNYAIVFSYGQKMDVTAESGSVISGLYFTNAAYALNSVLNGDPYSGDAFTTGDWFKMTVTGYGSNGEKTGDVETYLADYRSENAADHYYVKDWQWLDLSSLGTVKSISFTLSSSRTGDYGMNTPNYVCIDDVTLPVSTGVSSLNNHSDNRVVKSYNLQGYGQQKGSGLTLQKMADGSVRKVILK
ncbi:MAG: DUF4465 domain-containing protein [Prevotella sp.]